MEVFGAVVICIFASLFAIIMFSLLVVAGMYTVSYIISDFQARKHRWRIESRNRQLYKYIRNLDKYRTADSEDSSIDKSDCSKESEEFESCECQEDSKSNSADFDDVISKVLEG